MKGELGEVGTGRADLIDGLAYAGGTMVGG